MDYRSKIEIEGQVRIVTVPGYDVCACCAPHVKKTGEIGMLKLVNMVNYKGGERITMLCGVRALKDYEAKDANGKEISALLCAKELEIADAVHHMKEEQTALKSKVADLSGKLLAYRAKEIPVDVPIVTVFDADLSGNEPPSGQHQHDGDKSLERRRRPRPSGTKCRDREAAGRPKGLSRREACFRRSLRA